VRDNIETLHAAVASGFEGAALPPFVRRELEGYLDCGLLCRGFARLKCESCAEQYLVAFACKGRGICPSCMGRRRARGARSGPGTAGGRRRLRSRSSRARASSSAGPCGVRWAPRVVISAPLSVREAGFSLHAATRAGAADEQGREARLMYILRPPLSTERLLPGPDGLVRIALKKPFSDGTEAVDLDPHSLLCRLVALVPAPRFHTVRYSGVLAAASKWRPLIVPKPAPTGATDPASTSDQQSCGLPPECVDGSRYRPWALGRAAQAHLWHRCRKLAHAAADACASWPSSPTSLAPRASFVTRASRPSRPRALRLATHRTGRARLYDDTANPSSPRSWGCSKSTKPRLHRPAAKEL
jgi:hypothetical protein